MNSHKNAGAARPRHVVGRALVSVALLASSSIAVPSTALWIKGIPPSAVAGHVYYFQPTAVDPNGLAKTFAIANQPAWASFDPANGALSGTPTEADVGTYSNIMISVSDGYQEAVLTPFSIVVQNSAVSPPAGTGTVTLSWEPPTETTSGTVLTNLAGYRIYYGTTPEHLAQVVTVPNPGLTRYVISGLTSATWYFEMTAYDSNGRKSAPTPVLSLVMQ